jgi:hypothetical protein
MVTFGVRVEQQETGAQYSRLCAGCHDPVSARLGDSSFASHRGVSCLGCHDVDRTIRAGGNGDLQSSPHDWSADHKARALASLDTLRQPEFCGGCHEQFVPGAGLLAITTLAEYHASSYSASARCVDCHMAKTNGIADHRFPGGNVYLGQTFGDDVLVNAQMQNLQHAVTLRAQRVDGGVLVTVTNTGVGHGFPTGVTDIREPWVELQEVGQPPVDAGPPLLRIGGPTTDTDLLPAGAARLGIDIADSTGQVLYQHELNRATRIPFDVRVPAGEAQVFYIAVPPTVGPDAKLDAVLRYRNVRATYYRAATGDVSSGAPVIEVARIHVP